MGKCNNYTPDIQAQGDCIQCGCAFEDHESKKEYKPLSEWAPFKVGERFVRKGYDDCRGVIVVHSANLPTFMISGWKCGGLSFFDGILYTPLDRDTVEPEPEATVAPDYNNGDWWGWNGGECPVHPESIIQCSLLNDEGDQADAFYWGGRASWNPVIAFRVTKPYVEPPKPIETKTAVYRKEVDNG